MIRRTPAPTLAELSRRESCCRSCAHDELASVLSLGDTPLANSLLTRERLGAAEPRFPLDLVFCPECHLVQITETVSPELLYRDYVYASSFSDAFLRHARDLAERMYAERSLSGASLVVEIASNDGYLLRNYVARGVPVLGIEPARNIARLAREHGVATREDFFTTELAETLVAEGRQADVIHANNVLAHVPDLNGFVTGIRTLLAPTGVAVLEVPHLIDMIDHCEFDTIYHEHLCYFSLQALERLFGRHGLRITDVEQLPVHGGSLRIFAQHEGLNVEASSRVRELLAWQHTWEGQDAARYGQFGRRVETLLADLRSLLLRLHGEGATLAAYGASAKGSTLLNSLHLPPGLLTYVVDRSSLKQGRYTPGTHLPIVSPDRLAESPPDYLLLLTWNFADEILAQQAEYRRRGGRFVLPLPAPRIV